MTSLDKVVAGPSSATGQSECVDISGLYHPQRWTTLESALKTADLVALRQLAKTGVNFNQPICAGGPVPLEVALSTSVVPGVSGIQAVIARRAEVVKLLIEAGASVNGKTTRGQPLLINAILGDPVGSVWKQVLAAGAPVDEADAQGNTPLMHAVGQHRPEAVEKLLEKGAKVNAQNGVGDTAFHMAVRLRSDKCEQLLLRAKVNVLIPNNLGETARDMMNSQILDQYPLDVSRFAQIRFAGMKRAYSYTWNH
jgi:uncharacterized protein